MDGKPEPRPKAVADAAAGQRRPAWRQRALDAYERAAEARPSDPFLHYLLYNLYWKGEAEDRSRALAHLQAAQRRLPLNATPSYELAAVLYRLAAEAPASDAGVLKARALQALRDGNRAPAMTTIWIWPEYPSLLATQLRRMPFQDMEVKFDVLAQLRSVARHASTHAAVSALGPSQE